MSNQTANPASTPFDDCEKCGAPVYGYVAEMCCSGRECGCMGLPTSPCWCDLCWRDYTQEAEERMNQFAREHSI